MCHPAFRHRKCPTLLSPSYVASLNDSVSFLWDWLENSNTLSKDHICTVMPAMITDAITIAVICYSVTISLARLFAKRDGYRIDESQEAYAYGSLLKDAITRSPLPPHRHHERHQSIFVRLRDGRVGAAQCHSRRSVPAQLDGYCSHSSRSTARTVILHSSLHSSTHVRVVDDCPRLAET